MNRILLVIDNLEFGGGERVLLQLITGLRDRFEIFIASTQGGEFESKLKELGIKLFPVDMNRRLSWRPITQIRDIIRQNEIDLVHSQGARADFFARVAGRIADASHILCTVAMPVEGFNVGPIRKRIYRLLDQLSGHFVERFIVVSDFLRTRLIEGRGIPSERVVRIYNGIELDQYYPNVKGNSLRDIWHIPSSATLVGAIGRMVWQKGFEILIHAIPEIIRDLHDIRFLLVGDGPLKAHLERRVISLGLKEKVIFTGFQSDIRESLSAIDLLVIPSLVEGFPMITLEAMAMAKPIIASDIPGIREQIKDGTSGILVPSEDSKALAGAIIKTLADNRVAESISMAARHTVEEKFSMERMVTETERVYLSLLEEHKYSS